MQRVFLVERFSELSKRSRMTIRLSLTSACHATTSFRRSTDLFGDTFSEECLIVLLKSDFKGVIYVA